jgi:hypothetical protein
MDIRMRKPPSYIQLNMVRRAGGMAPVVECLPSKLKALSSNPHTTKGENIRRWGM